MFEIITAILIFVGLVTTYSVSYFLFEQDKIDKGMEQRSQYSYMENEIQSG
jgi:hypothetical protein